jgi:hypothetical protein
VSLLFGSLILIPSSLRVLSVFCWSASLCLGSLSFVCFHLEPVTEEVEGRKPRRIRVTRQAKGKVSQKASGGQQSLIFQRRKKDDSVIRAHV